MSEMKAELSSSRDEGEDGAQVEVAVDRFDFLLHAIPERALKGIKTIALKITCFDINEDLIVFGSNIGAIYGFRRGSKVTSSPALRSCVGPSSISSIKLIDSQLVAILSEDQVYVWHLKENVFLYKWKNSSSQDSRVSGTALEVNINHSTEQLILFTGDSLGNVWRHDVLAATESLLHQELELRPQKSDHRHQIVQLDYVSEDLLLVSSCYRSFFLRIEDQDKRSLIIQVGKNERKYCGRFGAVSVPDLGVAFASRPSSHLVKADIASGNAIETFIVKKAIVPQPRPQFAFLRMATSPSSLQLGYLIPLMVEHKAAQSPLYCIVSWTEHSLLIISTSGELLLKEDNLMTILEVRAISCSHGLDVFVLFENRYILRIKRCDDNNPSPVPIAETMASVRAETEFAENVIFPVSFTIPTLNLVETEIKKLFAKFQNVVLGEECFRPKDCDNNLDRSLSQDSSSLDDERLPLEIKESNDNLRINHEEPLVVERKRRWKRPGEGSARESAVDCSQSARSVSVKGSDAVITDTVSVSSEASVLSTNSASDLDNGFDFEEQSAVQFEVKKHDFDENERLLEILSAYKTATGYDSLSEKDGSEPEPDPPSEANLHKGDINQVNMPSEADPGEKHLELKPDEDQPIEASSIFFPTTLVKCQLSWDLILGNEASSAINVTAICASGYDDQMSAGFLWLNSHSKRDSTLYYVPGFGKLKSPSSQKVVEIGCSLSNLIILYDDGLIYMRLGMEPRKPLGQKWLKVKTSFKSKLICLSVNSSEEIIWFCDTLGQPWILMLKTMTWQMVADEGSLSPKFKIIRVSPQNAAIVWALDTENKLYVRQGFSGHSLVGLNWAPLECSPEDICNIAVGEQSLWVISGGGSRLLRRIGVEGPFNYMGREWEEVRGPTLVNDLLDTVSVSLSDDLWLLTALGSVWKHCGHHESLVEEVENDWLLL